MTAPNWNIIRSMVLPSDVSNLTIGNWYQMPVSLLRNIKGGRLHWRAAMAWRAMREAAKEVDIDLMPITARRYVQKLRATIDRFSSNVRTEGTTDLEIQEFGKEKLGI